VTIDSSIGICLRQAAVRDSAALAELRAASLTEMGLIRPAEASVFLRRARDEFGELFRTERIAAWLLKVDGVAAGCACALFWSRLPYPPSSLHAEIGGVYVVPAQRGRGYARELIAEAIAAARARGVCRIVLHPTERSRALYRKMGFTESGQLRLAGVLPAAAQSRG
jgi:GNAT superfamily N-acetyltransferase